MSVVIVGGNECMVCKYQAICKPVSYTHLDVYKRQDADGAQAIEPAIEEKGKIYARGYRRKPDRIRVFQGK